jgi:hypothetical protein
MPLFQKDVPPAKLYYYIMPSFSCQDFFCVFSHPRRFCLAFFPDSLLILSHPSLLCQEGVNNFFDFLQIQRNFLSIARLFSQTAFVSIREYSQKAACQITTKMLQ